MSTEEEVFCCLDVRRIFFGEGGAESNTDDPGDVFIAHAGLSITCNRLLKTV